VQRSSIGCPIALQDATKFSRVQRSLEGCDRWGEGRKCYISKTWRFSGKIFDPGGPGSGLEEDLVSGNSKFIFLADEYEAAKLRWAGRARSAPFGMSMSPKKTGARSARARTRGQNPLVVIKENF
jgi:hypothetical protein